MFYDTHILLCTNRDIESKWKMFNEKLHNVIENHVPSTIVSSSAWTPWFTYSLKTLLNKKKRVFWKACLSKSESARTRYDGCEKQYKRETSKAKKKILYSHASFHDPPQKFWQIINPSPQDSIKLNDNDNNPAPDHLCGEVFNVALASVFTLDSPINPVIPSHFAYPPMPDILSPPRHRKHYSWFKAFFF